MTVCNLKDLFVSLNRTTESVDGFLNGLNVGGCGNESAVCEAYHEYD